MSNVSRAYSQEGWSCKHAIYSAPDLRGGWGHFPLCFSSVLSMRAHPRGDTLRTAVGGLFKKLSGSNTPAYSTATDE